MKRTRAEMERRTIGLDWLGNATLEEYCVAVWLEEQDVAYMYQMPFAGFRAGIRADFQILHLGTKLVLEVQGDRWHAGAQQVDDDRRRRVLLETQGAIVVELWGHDIVEYDGYPVPTDEEFDDMMHAALSLQQVSFRYT